MLKQEVEIYEKAQKRMEYYSRNFKYLDGKVKNDVLLDMDIIKELRFSEDVLIIYKRDTNELIKKYLFILRRPIRRCDTKALAKAEVDKDRILKEYMDIIRLCIPYRIYERLATIKNYDIAFAVNYCDNCDNTNDFIKDNDVIICCRCFSEIIKMAYNNNGSSSSAQSFTASSSKSTYDRITHFKECLKQYQAKQNTFISPTVYVDIENALAINGILGSTPDTKFANVKKKHIMYFLKELGYNKHYDDYILIYTNLTGKPVQNLQHVESKLVDDFEKVSNAYSNLYTSAERKNFINTHFILFRLLQRNGCSYDPEDFSSMKSFDKTAERDQVCKQIFDSLGWKYPPDGSSSSSSSSSSS
jgi:hypothetical protein